ADRLVKQKAESYLAMDIFEPFKVGLFSRFVFPFDIVAIVMVAKYRELAAGRFKLCEKRYPWVHLCSVVIYQVAGKQDEVALLFINDHNSLVYTLSVNKAAGMDVGKLCDFKTVELLRKVWKIQYFFFDLVIVPSAGKSV